MDEFFVTPDLGVSSLLKAAGYAPEVVPQHGAPRALFRFLRTPQLAQALADLASGSLSQNPEDVARARSDLRMKAIFTVESHRSRA
jgi:hypothetical protein